MAKRITTEEDVERLSERVWRHGGYSIRDEDQFKTVFKDYMDGDITGKQEKLMSNTWDYTAVKHNLPTGKQWRPSKDMDIRSKPKKDFDFIGTIGKKHKVVRVRKTSYKRENKTVIVYRDEKGRFAKLFNQ